MKIKGKTALVAGASRGIGRAVARRLAVEGATLVLPWYDWPEDSSEMQSEFSSQANGHIFIHADLRKEEEVRKLAEAIALKTDGLHILINNIERGGMPVIHGSYSRQVNSEQWQLEMDTTLLAKRLLFEYCLPLMQQVDEAAVVNISSIAAITGRSGPAAMIFNEGYAAANRGIRTLTETWARLGAPRVRVNEIMLGLIDTRHGRGTRGWNEMNKEAQSALIDHTLLERTGTPGEVADTVLFLVRDATFMTGTVIRLDGGYALGGEKVPQMPKGVL